MAPSEKEIGSTLDQLSILAPDAAETSSKAAAFSRLQAQIPQNKATPRGTMIKQRTWAFGLTTILILAAVFSLPTFRAAASDFLGLFRVQKFAPISISPGQLAMLEQLAEEGVAPGELEVIKEPGAPTPVFSLVEAGATTGLNVRTLSDLGDPAEVNVIDGGEGSLRIDVAAARSLMETAGADPTLLPDSLDGARVHVTVFPGVQQRWGEDMVLMQAPSPLVEYPDDIDAQVIGEAALQVLGTEPREARRIARSIDWASTLLLPIPREMVTFNEATIDGVSGIALEPLDSSGGALMWQKDGIIYLLSGAESTTADLLTLVESLR